MNANASFALRWALPVALAGLTSLCYVQHARAENAVENFWTVSTAGCQFDSYGNALHGYGAAIDSSGNLAASAIAWTSGSTWYAGISNSVTPQTLYALIVSFAGTTIGTVYNINATSWVNNNCTTTSWGNPTYNHLGQACPGATVTEESCAVIR